MLIYATNKFASEIDFATRGNAFEMDQAAELHHKICRLPLAADLSKMDNETLANYVKDTAARCRKLLSAEEDCFLNAVYIDCDSLAFTLKLSAELRASGIQLVDKQYDRDGRFIAWRDIEIPTESHIAALSLLRSALAELGQKHTEGWAAASLHTAH